MRLVRGCSSRDYTHRSGDSEAFGLRLQGLCVADKVDTLLNVWQWENRKASYTPREWCAPMKYACGGSPNRTGLYLTYASWASSDRLQNPAKAAADSPSCHSRLIEGV